MYVTCLNISKECYYFLCQLHVVILQKKIEVSTAQRLKLKNIIITNFYSSQIIYHIIKIQLYCYSFLNFKEEDNLFCDVNELKRVLTFDSVENYLFISRPVFKKIKIFSSPFTYFRLFKINKIQYSQNFSCRTQCFIFWFCPGPCGSSLIPSLVD